ncbi:MAG TPA: Calx-beta domain-containing protein, partial [Albitalea sp.]
SRGAVSVQYATGAGSATPGADFQPATGSLGWADGDASPKSFSIPLVDDTLQEGPETFPVNLSGPAGGATLGAPATANVTIADNDVPVQTGSLQFSAPSYATAEGQGQVTITVTRTGGGSGAASVQFFTGPSSATAGSDYTATNGTLSWADGDTSAKSFSIPIVDDTQVEGSESFFVTLNNATGAALGSPATATVTIADNDAQTGCGPWQPGTYACSGSCDPCPTPQRLTIDGQRITVSPFHAGGAATFTGCMSPVASDSNTLVYFGQANHRATLTSSGNGYRADIQSSGGGTCFMTCIRTGP